MAVSCSETQRLVLANSLLPPLTCPRCLQAVAGQAPELAQWRPIAALLIGFKSKAREAAARPLRRQKNDPFRRRAPLPHCHRLHSAAVGASPLHFSSDEEKSQKSQNSKRLS